MVETHLGGSVQRWVSFGTNIVAPATLLSSLLFYYGYVSARSQYEYFGLDVDTIGLGTKDYIMRSPQPLLVPLLALTLTSVGLMILHSAISLRVATSATTVIRVARAWVAAGSMVLSAGVVLLLLYGLLGEWPPYNLVTPLLITIGAALTAYASRVRRLARRPAEDQTTTPPGDPAGGSVDHPSPDTTSTTATHHRTVGVLLIAVTIAGIFWATATVAQWSGRGVAHHDARQLDRLPNVILDTQERLFLRSPGIEETALPPSEGQTFHYRYRNLRLLIVGRDRMFLVPTTWSASDTTLIVPINESVRIQFQFQNERPN